MKPLLVEGMHGLGDNLHQRGVLKQLAVDNEIWLQTSWPSVYHDMNIKLIAKGTNLRTQLKNQRRQFDQFEPVIPHLPFHKRISYNPDDVRRCGSVLGAMCRATGTDIAKADFRLPIREEWHAHACVIVAAVRKPIMIYRPLVSRKEWGGCAARNPDIATYHALFESIRDQYFVISIADLVPNFEWIVSKPIAADMEFHQGELPFEALAALFELADLVFCSPGFAVPLAQAVQTPVICIFGGYESSRSFSAGARYSPYLGIDPLDPCECFAHNHACRKTIDIDQAKTRMQEFICCPW